MKHLDKGDDVIPAVEFDTAKNDQIQAQRKALASIPVSYSQYEYKRAEAYIKDMAQIPREDFTYTAMDRYIKALAVVGDYDHAYELSGDKAYQAIDKALRKKTKQCKCKGTAAVVMEKGKPVQKTYPAAFTKRKVYDQMTGEFVPLMACNVCGRLWI